MGLDQFVYFRKIREKCKYEDTCPYKDIIDEYAYSKDEDMYFRKNRHLQGFMERLYKEKGGKGEFNCKQVEVTKEDLHKLTRASLKDDKGFFWGDRTLDDDWTEIKKFKQEAGKALDGGYQVIYDSWW